MMYGLCPFLVYFLWGGGSCSSAQVTKSLKHPKNAVLGLNFPIYRFSGMPVPNPRSILKLEVVFWAFQEDRGSPETIYKATSRHAETGLCFETGSAGDRQSGETTALCRRFVYKILFGLVDLNSTDFFLLNNCNFRDTRQLNPYKLHVRPTYCRVDTPKFVNTLRRFGTV